MARQVKVEIVGEDRLSKSLSRAEHSTGRFGRNLARFGLGAARVVGGVGVAFAGLAAAGAVMGIKTEAGLEQAEIGFTQLLHSGTKAKRFIGELKSFAAKTPFELPGLIDAARGLLGAGEAAKRIIPDLRDLGDAAGALGLDQERFGRVMTAVTQIMNKGKVQSEELLQITEAGIPVWPLLAKAMGKPVPELQKLISAGKLSADEVLPKLFAVMHKDYGGSMATQSHTLAGLWSTFMDTINIGLAGVIRPFRDELKGGLTAAIKIVGDALARLTTFLSDPKSGLIPRAKEFWSVHGPELSAAFGDLFDKLRQLLDPTAQFGSDLQGASMSADDLASKIKTTTTNIGKAVDVFRNAGDVLNFVADYSDFLATALNRRLKLALLEAGEIALHVSKFILNIGVAAGLTGNVIDRFSGGSGHAFDSFVASARRMRDQTDAQLRGIRGQIQHTKDEIKGLRAPKLVFRAEDRVTPVLRRIRAEIAATPGISVTARLVRGGTYAGGGRITVGSGPRADDVLVRASRYETIVSAEDSADPWFRSWAHTRRIPGFQAGGSLGAGRLMGGGIDYDKLARAFVRALHEQPPIVRVDDVHTGLLGKRNRQRIGLGLG